MRFIAIDGEADSDGRYFLMCDSEGRVLINPEGITSLEAFEFLLSLPRRVVVVCYGLNYDVNEWLKDVPRSNLEELASISRTMWNGYQLEWIPSKMFTIRVDRKRVTICEVFGFFQTSFVRALEQWGFSVPEKIEVMKRRRGTFTVNELRRVIDYCRSECCLLVRMMERLSDACYQAGCAPRGHRWIGAGSIASSLLHSNGVKEHHEYDVDLFGREITDDYVLRAYFGGRIELYRQGWTDNVAAHDIRSAYPHAALDLPSLTDAIVRRTQFFDPSAEFALWRVKWEIGRREQIAPFPVRLSHGQIVYPRSGEGVYHAAEVLAAKRCGYSVTVLDGILLLPRKKEKPFNWISDVYRHRQRFQNQGSYAEKAIKLGLNSIYGKTAQGYGYNNSKPPFQSYFWAGYITARTRARVLELLCRACNPIMTATDGIVTTTKVACESDDIGGWEVKGYKRIGSIQPGVYVAETHDREKIVKSRGFFARDVDYDAMLDRFYEDPLSCYHYDSRRYVGLKVALRRKDFRLWRQWVTERRSVAFEVNNKIRFEDGNNISLWPIAGPFESLPYIPKQHLYDDPTGSDIENMVRDDQPHHDAE